jgi:hypothetical protein
LWRKKERGPGSGNNKERATFWEQKREGHVVGTKERGPGCVNKRESEPDCVNKRRRARLCEPCEQKREGQVA